MPAPKAAEEADTVIRGGVDLVNVLSALVLILSAAWAIQKLRRGFLRFETLAIAVSLVAYVVAPDDAAWLAVTISFAPENTPPVGMPAWRNG